MKMNQNYLVRRIRVYGIVQGVGFRPTVDRHAHAAGITGTVSNKGPYVEIMAAGTDEQISRFLHLLAEQPPKRAAILKIDVKEDDPGRQFDGFQIIESAKTKGEIFISPDIATCDECRKELFDPHNRRYLHPFINCTCCGPRLTILDALPYDRERTSMKEFPMCPQCAGEYYDPASPRMCPAMCNADRLAALAERLRQAVVTLIAIELQDPVEALQECLRVFSAAVGRIEEDHARWIIPAPGTVVTGQGP